MKFLRYLIFGFVVMVLVALAWILSDVVLSAFGIGGTLGMILSWILTSIIGGVLIVKIGLRFK